MSAPTVDLPAPEGPTTAMREPAGNVSDRPSRTGRSAS